LRGDILVLWKAEADRSLAARVRRRSLFFFRYLSAKSKSKSIAKLLPIIESTFDHPWVAGVETDIRFWPGNETRLECWWHAREFRPDQSMGWDAPITVSVFRKRKGKKRRALCLSLYLSGGTLYIGQLQGVLRTDPPDGLRPWPKMFIEACRTFVRQEKLQAVMVPTAKSLYSYRYPSVNRTLPPDARTKIITRIRRDMELLYDKNAFELGFVPDGDWLKSQNPRVRPNVTVRSVANKHRVTGVNSDVQAALKLPLRSATEKLRCLGRPSKTEPPME